MRLKESELNLYASTGLLVNITIQPLDTRGYVLHGHVRRTNSRRDKEPYAVVTGRGRIRVWQSLDRLLRHMVEACPNVTKYDLVTDRIALDEVAGLTRTQPPPKQAEP